jgi:hypothetical protein
MEKHKRSNHFAIVTTHRPSLDKVAALVLLRRFGRNNRDLKIGDDRIVVRFFDPRCHPLQQAPAYAERRERNCPKPTPRFLSLGVAGGPFDETRQPEEVCNTSELVARFLCVDRRPEVKLLLKQLQLAERGQGDFPAFGQMLRLCYEARPDEVDAQLDIVESVATLLVAWLDCRVQRNSLPQPTIVRESVTPVRMIAAVVTHEAQIGGLLKQCDVLIVRFDSSSRRAGTYQILTCSQVAPYMGKVVRALRLQEMRIAERPLRHKKEQLVLFEQSSIDVEVADRWHLVPDLGKIANGNPTHPDVAPSALNPTDVFELVKVCLAHLLAMQGPSGAVSPSDEHSSSAN